MKEIVYGSPPGSLGDMVTLLPLVDATKFTFVTYPWNMRCDLLKENAHNIIIDGNFPDEVETINKYGNMEVNNQNKTIHTVYRFLKTYGVYFEDSNLIPSLKFTAKEKRESDRFRNSFNKPPFAFSIQDARLYSPLSNEEWEILFGILAEKYTLIQVSRDKPSLSVPFFDLSHFSNIRDTATILRCCDGFIGTDSGLMHLAVACDTYSFCIHEEMGTIKFDNYAYIPDMWKDKECKAFYFPPGKIPVDYLMK